MSDGWGGARRGAGRKPLEKAARAVARRALAKPPAEPKKRSLPSFEAIAELVRASQRRNAERSAANSPFRLPEFPPIAVPKAGPTMATDNALAASFEWGTQAWVAGTILNGTSSEGLLFLGYAYLAELAQRPEYRVISETIADDATRKWIDFDVTGDEDENRREEERDPKGFAEKQDDPDERKKRVKSAGKTDKVKMLKDDQARLEVRDRFYALARDDGFFGRGHLFINYGDDIAGNLPELKTPIGDGRSKLSVGKLRRKPIVELKTIEAVWAYPQAYNAMNPLLPGWYDPAQWYVMGTEVHASRMLKFVGHPVPDMLKPSYSFGGLSLSQIALPYVDIWLNTRQAVYDLIKSFSTMVLSTDLSTTTQDGGEGLLMRMALFNALRDNNGSFVINKETEDFKNIAAPLGGLDHLQAQAQEHMASVSRIPLVKLTGISPSGLNASSEGEIQVYDDTIAGYQNRFFRPNLTKVINFEQIGMWGEVDPEITFRFEPLREMTDKERGDKQKADADRDQIYVNIGAISPEEVRKRIIDDEELPFTDLNPEDVPDLEQEEEQGLEPEGGRPQDGGEQPGKKKPEPGKERVGAEDAVLPFAEDAEFEESKHPRAPDGQFGKGSGGGKGKVKKSDKSRSWEDPALLSRSVRKAGFGKAGSKMEDVHYALETLNGEINSTLDDIYDITPEDRAGLKDDEEFTADQELRDALENTAIRVDDVRSQVMSLHNMAAKFLGEEEAAGNPDFGDLHATAAKRVESIASNLSNLASDVESAQESLGAEIEYPDDDEDELGRRVDALRDAMENLHSGAKEAISEIDLIVTGKHEDVEKEESEAQSDAAEWAKKTTSERAALADQQKAKVEKEDAEHTAQVNSIVDKALSEGWNPKLNASGSLSTIGQPSEIRDMASPRSQDKIKKRLDELGTKLSKDERAVMSIDDLESILAAAEVPDDKVIGSK